ncbi:MAG: hypothetical protein KGQ57_10735 [Burkholderiales bacterium]|nr:hypothetical protein [Burkholderiales bacterium]
MDTQKIAKLVAELDKARSDLDAIEYEVSLLNLSGHQQTIHVRIGEKGRSFSLAEIDHQCSYAAVAIRGTEMVMLGVKKLYAARVDAKKQHIKSIEARLRELTVA